MTTFQEALDRAAEERQQLLETITESLGRLELEDPPSFSPVGPTGDGADHLITTAVAVVDERAGQPDYDALEAAVADFIAARPPQPPAYDERSTPAVVISLAGLRRIQAILSELEQRREQERQ